MTLKKINAWLHLWLGLVSGIVIVIVSLTGALLVFEHEIKSLIYPFLHAEKPAGKSFLPPSVLASAVEQKLPGKKVSSIWYHGEGHTAHVTINADSTVYINPYTANVVAMADDEDFFHLMLEGHTHLWLPVKVGQQIVSWSTLIFLVLLVTGLVLWWPKKWNKKGREQSFNIKWKAKFKRLNYDLHNVLGFYSLIVALVLTLTGLIMGFAWFSKGVFWLAGETTSKPRIEALSDTSSNSRLAERIQVDRAWKLGMTSIGEHLTDQIITAFPKKASDPIYLCVDMYRGTWRDVYLDQHTLKELPASGIRLRNAKLANWIQRSNYGLHVGEIGGITTKIIYFLASIIAASLPITGFYIWWGKQRKSSKRRLASH